MTDLERLMEKVIPEPNSGCWLWNGATKDGVYGSVRIKTKLHRAHRVSYWLHKGPIPEGLNIDHLCRVTFCINPDHLEAVPQAENIRRGNVADVARARQLAKTHCPHGHAYDEINTYVRPSGRRKCRACNRIREQTQRSNP